MSIKIGTNDVKAVTYGNVFLSDICKGNTDVYNAIRGGGNVSFNSTDNSSLWNYRLYGNNSGTQTNNIFNPAAKDTTNGYRNNAFLVAGTVPTTNNNWAISEYIPILPNETYVLWWTNLETVSASAPSFELCDSRKNRIYSERYEDRGRFIFTTTAQTAYIRISFYKVNSNFTTIAKSNVMIDGGIPYGRQLNLTLTSGVHSDPYVLYLGDTGVLNKPTDYVDFALQKTFKTIGGVVTEYSPPEPFPAIQLYTGQNTITDSEGSLLIIVWGDIS